MARDAEGRWSMTMELPEGKYLYKFVVDGPWVVDRMNPDKEEDDHGSVNSIRLVRAQPLEPS